MASEASARYSALIWLFLGDEQLTAKVRAQIIAPGTTTFLSAASAMEIATKHRLGKLPEAHELARKLDALAQEQGLLELPVTVAHAALAGSLEIPHKDPFDRLLVAQARIEQLALVSNEKAFDAFGVTRLW
jgi:PIN domain nuclease of toxin-antitoxin system